MSDDWEEAVEGWLGSVKKQQTRLSYRRVLEAFRQFCGKELGEAGLEDAWRWREELEKEVYADSTIRTYLATVMSFYDEAVRRGLVNENPVKAELLPRQAPYASGRYLSEEEESRLLAAVDVDTPWGLRDYALILFLLRSGRRTGEVLGLRWKDFEVREDGVWYGWGEVKGNHKGTKNTKDFNENKEGNENSQRDKDGFKRVKGRRWARLEAEVWEAVVKYLVGCGRLSWVDHLERDSGRGGRSGLVGMKKDEVVFTPLTDAGGRLARLYGKNWRSHTLAEGSVGRQIQMYARWAGLPWEEYTPKALRYTAAARKVKEGMGYKELTEFMGYEDVDVGRVVWKKIKDEG
jgi:integrase